MLFVTLLFYLVLLVFGMGIGFLLVSVVSLLKMLRVWPYSVSLLVKVSAFLGILH